jgi:hypothetical protein
MKLKLLQDELTSKHKLVFIISFLLSFLAFYTCSDSDSIDNPFDYSGFTHTLEGGPDPVGFIDPDDWKPIDEINFIPAPAYPNPADSLSHIQFTISYPSGIHILVHDPKSNKRVTLVQDTLLAATHIAIIDLKPFKERPTLVRVFFYLTYENKNYTTYGDIKLE